MGTKILAAVSKARDAVTIQIEDIDGPPLAHSILDPSAAATFIDGLGKARAALLEKVSDSLDPNSIVGVEAGPAWNIPATHIGPPSVLLILRHSGFGWLGFALEAERAKQIGQALIKRADELAGDNQLE